MQSSDRLTPVLLIMLLYFLVLPTIAAAEPVSQAMRVFGEGSALGNGMAWTWVEYIIDPEQREKSAARDQMSRNA